MKKPQFTLQHNHVTLPVGTRVVLTEDLAAEDGFICKQGTIARISSATHPQYTVTTPAGRVVLCQRSQIVIQKQRARFAARHRAWSFDALEDHICLAVVVGSKAWNLADASSDTDIRGSFLLPFDMHTSFWETRDEIASPHDDSVYWEVEKTIRQALRADANTLEMLWAPDVIRSTSVGDLLRTHRDIFVSKHIYRSFGRYAISQFEKIQHKLDKAKLFHLLHTLCTQTPTASLNDALAFIADQGHAPSPQKARGLVLSLLDSLQNRSLIPSRTWDDARTWLRSLSHDELETHTATRPKNAYNLLRLLHSGMHWMTHEEPLIAIRDDHPGNLRTRLLDVKHARIPLQEVLKEAHQLARDFETAFAQSPLPDEPDTEAAADLLQACRSIAARRAFAIQCPTPPDVEDDTRTSHTARFDLPTDALQAFLKRYEHVDTVFCSITGAHNFGFPSPDSDFDLKGMHIIPAHEALSLTQPRDTIEFLDFVDGLEMDYTSHEAAKALRLLLQGNGNVLERILSPYTLLPTQDAPALALERLEHLRAITLDNLNTRFARHYLGFFKSKSHHYKNDPTIKALLYMYRVVLTGLHLIQTGRVLPDLSKLLELYPDPHAQHLIELKTQGLEKMPDHDLTETQRETILNRLFALDTQLREAVERSPLPSDPPRPDAFNDWLRYWRTTPII